MSEVQEQAGLRYIMMKKTGRLDCILMF
ncbi:hypothetical protein AB8Q18_04415 [Neisseriaceae bacterium CLB008]